METGFSHYSVMKNEAIEGLAIKPDGVYLDCTAGGGGHSLEIVKRLENGKLIAVDQDPAAIEAAGRRLSEYSDKVRFARSNFSEIESVLGDTRVDGVLIDLGVSSYQLDTPERGFSYNHDAPLDMRMNPDAAFTARELVNNYSEQELRRVIRDWGEERFASRISSFIVDERERRPIETTFELVEIIKKAIPAAARDKGPHPAKRTFQAIRIEVNRELDIIEPTIRSLAPLMNSGGRIAIITFHSLEDRIVKQTYQSLASGCTCPSDFPICVCGKKPTFKIITKHPIVPGEKELEENPRSRSAKLRIAEKI